LEERIRDRTAELIAANEELETFTYSIAHDLRAPLRQIHGYAQILEEECGETLSEEGLRYLHRISQRGKDMGQMVDDLLKLSLVSKQELGRERASLENLLQESRASLQQETDGRNIEWAGTPLPEAFVSVSLMRQVFVNLLSNAVKYSRPRNPARIETGTVRVSGPLGPEEAVYVRDNGVGFDMRQADRLFGVFQRLHSAKDFEGTGVGLALVARVVRRHGGRIWAEGEPDKGATFYFTLGSMGGNGHQEGLSKA
ncbi:MAG TPA: ATP-binding protein, partial [Candidatus Methylacidiphilales bacterium]